jgi:hypothetical protein
METRRDMSGEHNSFFGKTHSDASRAKQQVAWTPSRKADSGKRSSARTKGRSYEERYGSRAGFLKDRIAQRVSGSGNPAYGKVYDGAGGRGIQGRYQNLRFRSSYEYSFLKHLENLGADILSVRVEPVRIPYVFAGVARHYTPDYLLGTDLYEIKSQWHAEQSAEVNSAKYKAAEAYCLQRGWTFHILCETDFRVLSPHALRDDPMVVLCLRKTRP